MDKKCTLSFPRKTWLGCLSAFIASSALVSPAYAQLEQQTITADPARVGDTFREQTVLPQVGGDVTVAKMQAQGAPAGAENIRFVLNGIRLEGNSSLSESQVRNVYSDRLGQEITLAELYEIAAGITTAYRNRGFVLSQVVIPPQTIEGGNPRLQVVEGYIDRIQIQAPEEEGTALGLIREYASQISTGGALNVKELERELLLINDLPGVSARSVLSPSRTQAGASDLLIIVERDPYDALLAMDNFGSRYLGPLQLSAAGTANSYFNNNEAISAQFVMAPDGTRELAYGALGYEQPIGPYGTKIRAFGSMTDTDPGYDLDQFQVRGFSDLMSVSVTHPFVRSRALNFTGRATFDWRDVESKNNFEDTRKDRIRSLRIGGRVEFLDTLLGVAVNSIDVEVSKGLNLLGSSDEGDANLTRANGDPTYTKLEAEIQRLQRVTNGINLLVLGQAQWSADALLSSEEFGVGGSNIGRGYDPSEVIGDEGISAKIEAQWNDPHDLQWRYVDTYQLYGFLDAGRVWNDDATTSADKRDSLVSTGAGVRVDFISDVDAEVGVAVPLTRRVQADNDRDAKVYFNVSKRF